MKSLVMTLVVLGAGPDAACYAQHTVVLRDLTLLHDVRVIGVDANGIELSDRRQLQWHEVLRGSVEPEQQAEFDRRLNSIGLPLFRIRTRMELGNFGELQPMAGQLYEELKDSPGPSLYAVCAALFHDRLAKSDRELAAVPLMQLLELRQQNRELSRMDSSLGLTFLESEICQQLLPVWFDSAAAKTALEELASADIDDANSVDPIRPQSIYATSLQRAVEPVQIQQAESNDPWRLIFSAQSALFNGNPQVALESLKNLPANQTREQEAIALYYEGLALQQLSRGATDQESAWLLKLLQIPASFQNEFPELSAAAIFEILQDPRVDQATHGTLQKELAGRFTRTWHGRRFQELQEPTTR
ncbi:MAG: hypothetical protein ACR2NP_07775 [Pirellulaceae bacterium]